MSSASPWTLLTHGLNVLVWRLPLPRRVLVRLSGWIYRNPPMSAGRVYETLALLAGVGLQAWCMGGWGADALLGEQSRVHRDLDLVMDRADEVAALAILSQLGYKEWYRNLIPAGLWYRMPASRTEADGTEDVVVVRDAAFRAVDIHFIALSQSGLSSAPGIIDGNPVRCLSAESQALAYASYRARHGYDHQNLAIVRQFI
jgi:lincosamide nucleotidyltransferase A/C/D/E